MAETSRNTDPLNLRDQLREALAQPALASFAGEGGGAAPPPAEARQAAYELAVALGSCRLFGIELGAEVEGDLPTAVALAAADELIAVAEQGVRDAQGLGEEVDAAEEAVEAESACCDLLETAMETWAAYLAIDDAYQYDLEEVAADLAGFTDRIGACLDALDRFDAALQERADLLTLAAGTELLRNWRVLLAEEYGAAPPWWLDGTLEELAGEVERLVTPRPRTPPGREIVTVAPEWEWLHAETPLAVAADKEAPYAPPTERWWKSPDGRLWGCVSSIPGEPEVRLNLEGKDRDTLLPRVTSVSLGGVLGIVEQGRDAVFRRDRLHEARCHGFRPVLMVEGVEWIGPFDTLELLERS